MPAEEIIMIKILKLAATKRFNFLNVSIHFHEGIEIYEYSPINCRSRFLIRKPVMRAGGMAPVVEDLPNKYEAMRSSNTSTAKKKKKKKASNVKEDCSFSLTNNIIARIYHNVILLHLDLFMYLGICDLSVEESHRFLTSVRFT
jgi:hypothetical protein